jgi:hypothetical protein
MNNYYQYKMNMVVLAVVFFGALNSVTSIFGFNIIEKINSYIKIDKFIGVIILFSVIYLATKKTMWLPFLGETVLPQQLIPLKTFNGDTQINVTVKPNTKVVYWSATPSADENRPVNEAYANYDNSGVVVSDANGNAILNFNKGTGYIVPGGKHIKPHIHYRELNGEWGMIGPVKTVFL